MQAPAVIAQLIARDTVLREALSESADVVGHRHRRDQHVVHRAVVGIDNSPRVLPRNGLWNQALTGLATNA